MDKNLVIDLENKTRARIMEGVLGQLSDGMWENSSRMEKYWNFIEIDGTDLVIDTSYNSGFAGKSETWIKQWLAKKLKAICQEEVGNNTKGWSRMNTEPCEYISYHEDIKISHCYECYDFLLDRVGHVYGHTDKDE